MHWIKIIFCLVIGAVACYYGLKLLRLYLKVHRWEKTKATVISKSVIPKRLASGSRNSKAVSIQYTYHYNNVAYKNNKVFLVELLNGEKGFTTQGGESFLGNVGNEVEIFVDPKNPTQSVMYCDGLLVYLFVILVGAILLFVGLVYLLLAI